MMNRALAEKGYLLFPAEAGVHRWAAAAGDAARQLLSGPIQRRHGDTWFVGVDALPNAADGSIGGVPLAGAWRDHIRPPAMWHPAQLSVIFPGYPGQDQGESDAAHRYRRDRDAAHVDGLLPEGPLRRRHLREPHGFIVGFPLSRTTASPLVVWPGSHIMMQRAFASAFEGTTPEDYGGVDVTTAYQAARREVFANCRRVPLHMQPGQAVLLHRHLLHGVAPWRDVAGTSEGRMVAYFRPQVTAAEWLSLHDAAH